jgi:hypothetical protein
VSAKWTSRRSLSPIAASRLRSCWSRMRATTGIGGAAPDGSLPEMFLNHWPDIFLAGWCSRLGAYDLSRQSELSHRQPDRKYQGIGDTESKYR